MASVAGERSSLCPQHASERPIGLSRARKILEVHYLFSDICLLSFGRIMLIEWEMLKFA